MQNYKLLSHLKCKLVKRLNHLYKVVSRLVKRKDMTGLRSFKMKYLYIFYMKLNDKEMNIKPKILLDKNV